MNLSGAGLNSAGEAQCAQIGNRVQTMRAGTGAVKAKTRAEKQKESRLAKRRAKALATAASLKEQHKDLLGDLEVEYTDDDHLSAALVSHKEWAVAERGERWRRQHCSDKNEKCLCAYKLGFAGRPRQACPAVLQFAKMGQTWILTKSMPHSCERAVSAGFEEAVAGGVAQKQPPRHHSSQTSDSLIPYL